MQPVAPGRVDEELAKADELRDPPVPVIAWLHLDSREWAGELYGWAADPNGADDGWRGLVLAPREFAPGFWTEFRGTDPGNGLAPAVAVTLEVRPVLVLTVHEEGYLGPVFCNGH